jgi:hypothetical protein
MAFGDYKKLRLPAALDRYERLPTPSAEGHRETFGERRLKSTILK